MEPESRYANSLAVKDPEGRVYLTDPEPFAFRELPDTIEHHVIDGDSWHRIAGKHYEGSFTRPEHLWWVIAAFQPKPVLDPTLLPETGSIVYVPSPRTLITKVFASERARPGVRSPSLVPA